jgi:hypothetical protein
MVFPEALTSQLKAGDNVLKFVELKHGWIALTEQRVLYSARMYFSDGSVVTKTMEHGNLPIEKITSIAVRQITKKVCFLKKKFGVAAINMQGAVYYIIVGKDTSNVQPLISEFISRTN